MYLYSCVGVQPAGEADLKCNRLLDELVLCFTGNRRDFMALSQLSMLRTHDKDGVSPGDSDGGAWCGGGVVISGEKEGRKWHGGRRRDAEWKKKKLSLCMPVSPVKPTETKYVLHADGLCVSDGGATENISEWTAKDKFHVPESPCISNGELDFGGQSDREGSATPPLTPLATPPMSSRATPPLRSHVTSPLMPLATPPMRSSVTHRTRSHATPPLRSHVTHPLRSHVTPPLMPPATPPLRSRATPMTVDTTKSSLELLESEQVFLPPFNTARKKAEETIVCVNEMNASLCKDGSTAGVRDSTPPLLAGGGVTSAGITGGHVESGGNINEKIKTDSESEGEAVEGVWLLIMLGSCKIVC